jgi:5,5'-dehydrodivanillate O-demethylase oxygenase subunit
VLDEEKNRSFVEVSRGTPMGELLRRHWMPIAAVSELEQPGVKAVRLLGEDLVLYKDLSGDYGLLDRHCPHRRADLSYGFVETCGIRCNYHGWLFDAGGTCLEQPFEDTANAAAEFRHRIRSAAYPVRAAAGLLWAYLGPPPAPLVPNWEPFTWQNGFRQIVFSEIPCNWFQCQENSIDPVHFEWMHSNWRIRQKGAVGPYVPTTVRIGFDEFEYGYSWRRITADKDETDEYWTIGRVCLWPNALYTSDHIEWRVPIDDENTLSVTWAFTPAITERRPFVQDRIPYWYGPIKDPRTGRWITSHTMNQDFVAWVGQGVVADRSKEHLGGSDRGITMIRKRLLEDMQAVSEGRDPKGIVRDERINECIRLPVTLRDYYTNGISYRDYSPASHYKIQNSMSLDYLWQVGEPEDIRRRRHEAITLPRRFESESNLAHAEP